MAISITNALSKITKKQQNVIHTEKTYHLATAAKTAAMTALYHTLGRPDVIIGFVPLYHAQMVEVTTSQDIVKYRAVGGQFLAHQQGGQYAVRIDAKLPDIADAMRTLTFLQLLHVWGEGKDFVNLDSTSTAKINVNKPVPVKSYRQPISRDNLEYTSINDWEFIKSTWHKTFSIITPDQILYNMYIESFIYWRSVRDDDPNTINISVLCRKFTPPPKITAIKDEMYKRKYATETRRIVANANIIADLGGQVEIWKGGGYGGGENLETLVTHHDAFNYNIIKAEVAEYAKRAVKTVDRIPNNIDQIELIWNIVYRTSQLVINGVWKAIDFKTSWVDKTSRIWLLNQIRNWTKKDVEVIEDKIEIDKTIVSVINMNTGTVTDLSKKAFSSRKVYKYMKFITHDELDIELLPDKFIIKDSSRNYICAAKQHFFLVKNETYIFHYDNEFSTLWIWKLVKANLNLEGGNIEQ